MPFGYQRASMALIGCVSARLARKRAGVDGSAFAYVIVAWCTTALPGLRC